MGFERTVKKITRIITYYYTTDEAKTVDMGHWRFPANEYRVPISRDSLNTLGQKSITQEVIETDETLDLPRQECLPLYHIRQGACYYCCDTCNYDRHSCPSCGDHTTHDDKDYGTGKRHPCYEDEETNAT